MQIPKFSKLAVVGLMTLASAFAQAQSSVSNSSNSEKKTSSSEDTKSDSSQSQGKKLNINQVVLTYAKSQASADMNEWIKLRAEILKSAMKNDSEKAKQIADEFYAKNSISPGPIVAWMNVATLGMPVNLYVRSRDVSWVFFNAYIDARRYAGAVAKLNGKEYASREMLTNDLVSVLIAEDARVQEYGSRYLDDCKSSRAISPDSEKKKAELFCGAIYMSWDPSGFKVTDGGESVFTDTMVGGMTYELTSTQSKSESKTSSKSKSTGSSTQTLGGASMSFKVVGK